MPQRYSLAIMLALASFFLVSAGSNAQPCPESLSSIEENANYLEINSPGNTVKIPLHHIRIFPEGKERIYMLLPDILTNSSTPIIRWNELVLKKPLNSSEKWTGTIDRKSFFPTPCIPLLEDAHFSSAESNQDFIYQTENNTVSVKGSISFPQISGRQLIIHLNVDRQTIPLPLINDLDGQLFTREGAIPITSGEISYIPTSHILKGSGTAEGTAINQSFEFLIKDYKGEPGIYLINEGTDSRNAFFVYKVEGKPAGKLTIFKYALNPKVLESSAFFRLAPFDVDALDSADLVPAATFFSESVLIDPKPAPTLLSVANNAFEGNAPNLEQLKKLKSPEIANQGQWTKSITFTFENLPIWNLHFTEDQQGDSLQNLQIGYLSPENPDNQPALSERLTFNQVEQINAGFMEIFKNFDETSDTVQLKTAILELFSANNLPTEATMSDDFEPFLVTTISGFREAERYALTSGTGDFSADMNTQGLELLPIDLILKKDGLKPVSRSFDFHGTSILIRYGTDSIEVTTSNETQRKQSTKIPNSNLFDIYQFYGIISSLPLKEDYEADLSFFDVTPVFVTHLGQETTQERLVIQPGFVHAWVRVMESLTYQGEPAFKLSVQFNGLSNPLFAEFYEENYTGTYYVSRSFPHQIIRANFEQGLVLQ
ncbi:hypothetical protein SAMN04488057_103164 [Cyclobacterium lianum]|uniref:Uncharacterized protein n=1 Tax=Cyclobacterium lianum TaxID=388280 RepID=A0A1M7L8P1_9BACT|nr:hypothetical protein [Cyclobacterium lianum]SHM74256.1 hypothetical protein SAMN04488057_103164 [Cyclobacterium lianum]